jgi:hypothetical protein
METLSSVETTVSAPTRRRAICRPVHVHVTLTMALVMYIAAD